MPRPAEIQTYRVNLEIIPPIPFSRNCQRCECCGERKPACAFEEDGFGICTACLDSDTLALEGELVEGSGARSDY